MSDTQNSYLNRAIDLAMRNIQSPTGGPFGALVVKDGKIIAEGVNQVTLVNDPTAHAEIVAIRKACEVLGSFDLSGCELYSSCEPCPMCLGAIYWARPSKVYFASTRKDAARAGFDDELIYTEILVSPPDRKIPMQNIALDSAQALFKKWSEKKDKIEY